MAEDVLQRRRRRLGAGLMTLGVVGAVAALAATVVGVRFLGALDRALDQSTEVTATAVGTLGESVDVAQEVVGSLEQGLVDTESTTRGLVEGFRGAAAVLGSTADLTENEIATGLESVEGALPALIDVAAVVDTTLGALSSLPFGPDYDPPEPFDESLRSVRRQLAPLPAALREQADLVRESQASLAEVGDGAVAIADELRELRSSLADASDVLAEFARTAADVDDLVRRNREDLGAQLALSRGLLVVLGLVLAAGQVVPLGAGWWLRDPAGASRLLGVRADQRPAA